MSRTISDRNNAFIFVMYIFSALGLLGLVVSGLFQIDLGDTFSLIAFLLIGVGFISLSNVLGIRKFLDDGRLDGDELASIIIGGIGFIILVIAGLDLFNVSFLPDTTSGVIQGLVAALLLAIITFQLVLSLKRR